MKINGNALDNNKESEKKISYKAQQTDISFENIFKNMLPKEFSEVNPISGIASIDPLLMHSVIKEDLFSQYENTMDSIDSVMVSLSKYAEDLSLAKKNGTSLASLHESLVGIENSITRIKDKFSDELQTEPLRSLMHSVELLVLTEKYKMNRGDYI